MDQVSFRQHVERALTDLRDSVRLQTMPLCDLLVPGTPRSERGWQLSRYLLEALEGVRPEGDAADEWAVQRYRILTLRYGSGLTPDQVADRLAISRRHFYRQLQRALDEFADFLWIRVAPQVEPPEAQEEAALGASADARRMRLLWRESATLSENHQAALLPQVLQSVLSILDPVYRAHAVSLQCDLPEGIPELSLSPEILKQLLFTVLGEMLPSQHPTSVQISAAVEGRDVLLTVLVEQEPQGAGGLPEGVADVSERASAQLAVLQGVDLHAERLSDASIAYHMRLPVERRQTVLVVDDNEDVCLLLRRYLVSGGYHPLIARNAAEAIQLAQTPGLYAITLDLMMSDFDGWDLLHKLRQEPASAHVPIIVCSVLDQENLAFTLGATGFIRKPVMREQLLSVLGDISAPPPADAGALQKAR